LRKIAFSARACSDKAFAASTARNLFRASRSALDIGFGDSYSPGVFVTRFPIYMENLRRQLDPTERAGELVPVV
jgi:hypothetical protein